MASIAYSDITVTPANPRRISGRQKEILCKMVFGDSALTYPSGGIDLSSAAAQKKFGHTSPLRYLIPVQNQNLTSNVQWIYDPATQKLRGFATNHIPPVVVNDPVTL